MLKHHREVCKLVKKQFPGCKITLKNCKKHVKMVVRLESRRAVATLSSSPSCPRESKNVLSYIHKGLR
jgi:hypothetical protein